MHPLISEGVRVLWWGSQIGLVWLGLPCSLQHLSHLRCCYLHCGGWLWCSCHLLSLDFTPFDCSLAFSTFTSPSSSGASHFQGLPLTCMNAVELLLETVRSVISGLRGLASSLEAGLHQYEAAQSAALVDFDLESARSAITHRSPPASPGVSFASFRPICLLSGGLIHYSSSCLLLWFLLIIVWVSCRS